MSLGSRIQYFRKRADLSQFDLENEIGGSQGMLSRIENGSINPTKETLYKIADVLKLHYREFDYLMGMTSKPATDSEIQEALKEVEEYFSKKVLAYLIDERWRLFAATDPFLKAINLDQEYIKKLRGRTTVEFLTDPDLGILDRFSQNKLEDVLRNNLQYYYKEVGFMQDDEYFQNSVRAIRKNPLASRIWDEIVKANDYKYPVRVGRVVYFNVFKTFDVPMIYNYEPLLNASRFQLVVWTPENKFLKTLTKLL